MPWIAGRNPGVKDSAFLVIALWWVVNLWVLTKLQGFDFRPVGSAGVELDIKVLAPIDAAAIFCIWLAVVKGRLVATWLVFGVGIFLVANLIGYAVTALMLWQDHLSADIVATMYDEYVHMTFTLLLLLQAIGGFGDMIMQRTGKIKIDVYRDISPVFSRLAHWPKIRI